MIGRCCYCCWCFQVVLRRCLFPHPPFQFCFFEFISFVSDLFSRSLCKNKLWQMRHASYTLTSYSNIGQLRTVYCKVVVTWAGNLANYVNCNGGFCLISLTILWIIKTTFISLCLFFSKRVSSCLIKRCIKTTPSQSGWQRTLILIHLKRSHKIIS